MGGFPTRQAGPSPLVPESPVPGLPPANASNQYGLLPPSPYGPGIAGALAESSVPGPVAGPVLTPAGAPGSGAGPGSGLFTESPTDPTLAAAFNAWLESQIGQGAPAFNQSTQLATGGSTTPGAVNAPMNPLLQMLQQYFQTGQSNVPGLNTLTSMAATGDPTNTTPAVEAAIAASQQNIAQNAAALREQSAFSGNLNGSPFGNSISNFYSQTAADENALLVSTQANASEAAAGRQLSAAGTLSSMAENLGQIFQGMDQQDVTNTLNEFIRTNPQYSPLLNLLASQSNSYAPIVSNKGYGSSLAGPVIGALTSIFGPGLAKAVGNKINGPAAAGAPIAPAASLPADSAGVVPLGPTAAPPANPAIDPATAIGAGAVGAGVAAGVGAGVGAAAPAATGTAVSTNLITDPAAIGTILGTAGGPAAGAGAGAEAGAAADSIGPTTILDSGTAAAGFASTLLSALGPAAAAFAGFNIAMNLLGTSFESASAQVQQWALKNPVTFANYAAKNQLDNLTQQLSSGSIPQAQRAVVQQQISQLQQVVQATQQQILQGKH